MESSGEQSTELAMLEQLDASSSQIVSSLQTLTSDMQQLAAAAQAMNSVVKSWAGVMSAFSADPNTRLVQYPV
eukprot:ANDGO_03306.mRNA.1 hypothetical protein